MRLFFLFTFLGLLMLSAEAFEPLYERAPIHYHETQPDTVVTRLLENAKPGGPLATGDDREILNNLLELLEVPVESQVLVFSKTSAQNSRISPRNPRAIYFSDDVYLGWVQGGEIEVASMDPKLGMVFHLIKLTTREPNQPPEMVRERSCLNCHAGSSNQNLPGVMVRSVFAERTGQPLFQAGTFHTRQDSQIEERWGGWYVTGSVEERSHMGNSLALGDRRSTEISIEPLAEGPLETLGSLFDVDPYLHGGQSDVVALMMLEHQVGMHNVLVEANLTTQTTLHRHREMQKAFGEPIDAPLSDTSERIFSHLTDRVLKQMLYVDEIELPGGIEGGSAFQEAFARNRIKSSEGRSLRDFRLYGRLMKYRCSHLIYSESFDQLPDEIRNRILERLHGILTDPVAWPDYAYLSDSERGHILEIVSETVPRLTESWNSGG